MQSTYLGTKSWQSQARAVLAIAKKDWLHFLRYPLNAVFRILQPIIWLTPVYFLGQSFAGEGGNLGFANYAGTADYMSFVLVGAILSDYVSAVFWGMGFALKTEMDSGVLETNWLTPVPRPLFLVGQTLASLSITTLTSAGVLLLAWLFFGFSISGNLAPALLVAIPTLIALYGFGFAFAALVLVIREANTLVDVSNFVVTLLSGSQFPVRVLPPALLAISLALPLTYGYDAIRGYLLGVETLLPIRYEIAILVVFMGVMVGLGYVVFKVIEHRCREHGTIGMH
jgi:ABC-2 type transport system permease protein